MSYYDDIRDDPTAIEVSYSTTCYTWQWSIWTMNLIRDRTHEYLKIRRNIQQETATPCDDHKVKKQGRTAISRDNKWSKIFYSRKLRPQSEWLLIKYTPKASCFTIQKYLPHVEVQAHWNTWTITFGATHEQFSFLRISTSLTLCDLPPSWNAITKGMFLKEWRTTEWTRLRQTLMLNVPRLLLNGVSRLTIRCTQNSQ